ncbi:MAG TPA: SDR family oxidoreductase [Burkholderiales bacterium]|nr:SDR family oxidoreductase [Burkholderiales bacterium]
MARPRIAVVTGGNKGIGFEICRQLAARGINVVLTARSRRRGTLAARKLQGEGLNVIFHPLDVTVPAEVQALARYLDAAHGRCDVLVNNAGVALDRYSMSVLATPLRLFRDTLDTNFYGPLRLCQALMPMMLRKRYGRVVNLSSGLGQLEDMEDGSAAYRVSKTALNALTRMAAAAAGNRNVLVNSMCPGWVRTDMGGRNAARSVEKGAETAVWLATLPEGGPSGGFFRDRRPMPW